MKNLLYATSLLFLTLIVSSKILAQNVVTYDFNTNAFDKTIPFDELITFKFTHIPIKSISSFIFKCSQIKMINDSSEFLFSVKVNASSITNDSTATLVRCTYFAPNRDFIFEIELLKERELTSDEKNFLLQAIDNSNIISRHLDRLYASILEDKFENLGEQTTSTFYHIKYSIDSISKTIYGEKIKFPDGNDALISQLRIVINLSTELQNLNRALRELKNDPSFLNGSEEDKVQTLKHLENEIKKLGFFPFTNFKDVDQIVSEFSKDNDSEPVENMVEKWSELKTFKDKYADVFLQKLIADALIEQMTIIEFTSQSYPKGLVEQSKNYFAVDIGSSYIPALDQFIYFTSASFYFRPVKRSIPLSMYRGWDFLWTRLSVDVGISLNSIEVANEIKGFKDTNKGLLLGAGFRILPFLKVNTGSLVYQAKNKNPLINNYSYQFSWYVGASIDLSVSALFKENFSGTPGKN